MAIEVLLMADVAELGSEGDVVKVADGYARNYLLPRKLAEPLTERARQRLDKIRQLRAAGMAEALAAARVKAGELKNVSCTIAVKASEDQKLYGSVSSADIVEALTAQGVQLDRHMLVLDQPIKELGVFDVPVRFHPDVEATIKVWVVQE